MCVEGLYRIYTPPSILDIISLAPVSALYNKMIYWSMLHSLLEKTALQKFTYHVNFIKGVPRIKVTFQLTLRKVKL